MRRRHWSPLAYRRLAYLFMLLAALTGGLSGYRDSALWMTGSLVFAVAACAVYARAADFLMDFDLRSVRRQSTVFLIIGLVAAIFGCVVASQMVRGDRGDLVRAAGYAAISGGIAVGLSGLIATLWSMTATYAGEQIEKRSLEDW